MFNSGRHKTRNCLLLLFLSVVCGAQTKSDPRVVTNATAQGYLLKKITSSGSTRFSEVDIIKASGLKPGVTVTSEDLKQAADRLGRCGVFSQVSYRFNGDTALFTVVDAQQFVPVTFENFIWFADADLLQRLRDSLPLFNGTVPLAGNLVDQISASLDVVLKEKGIQGHTTSMLQGKLAGSMQAVQFQIDGVDAKIGEIRFPGAAPDRAAQLQKVMKLVAGENYLQSFFKDIVAQNAPLVYGRLGFLKTQFGAAKPVLLKDNPVQPVVAVEVPVQEGDQFTFAGANWNGVNAIPAAELSKTLDLKPGAIADTTQIGAAINKAKDLYGTRGYMFAQVKSTATLDNEKHTAIFNLSVTEGPLYHMGKLEIQAPDPERAELVRRVWGMHEGDVYDSSYVKTFMIKHPRELTALNGWAPHFTQTIHDDTHVVDLALKFEKFQREAK